MPKGTTAYQDEDGLVVKYEVMNNSKSPEKHLECGHVRVETYESKRGKGEDIIKKGSTISSIETYKLTDLELPVLLC